MARTLKVSIGQNSDKGRKDTNQDFHGAMIPGEPMLTLKGIAVALADGISSSEVSHVAAQSAVKSLLTDYYCTSDAWSVKTSAQRVIAAANSWLHAQTYRSRHEEGDSDRGHVCTLSALIIKGASAHLFHIGDARIYRLAGGGLEPLTADHRVVVSSEQSYLGRALGVNPQIEIDYREIAVEPGDVFLLATDGVYDHMDATAAAAALANGADLDQAACDIVAEAYRRGSPDNLTVQIVRIEELPDGDVGGVLSQAEELQLPPLLEPRMVFDGYRILRELHGSSRSHVYLASDSETGQVATLKVPSTELRADPAYLRRFMMEEWVARRIDNAHVLKAFAPTRRRSHLYVAMEHIEGQTLRQWMTDNPRPELETVRGIVEQIARGLQAFHRLEMLHQDLRPENVMIDTAGTVKIIDFGSTRVRGVSEAEPDDDAPILGTAQYTAPEYFLGDAGSPASDIFALGVIAYEMLTGRLPYGSKVARTRTRSQQRKLRYVSALDETRAIPGWVDQALRRAVHPDPARRYQELSEFVYDLRHPNPEFAATVPLIERDPLLVWKALCAVLALTVFGLLIALLGPR